MVLLLIAVGSGTYYAAGWAGFTVKNISVKVPPSVSSSEVLQRAAISTTGNIWLQNMRAAQSRIKTIPYVLDARIQRKLPASLAITITARIPFAIVETPLRSALIDRELRVLELAPSHGRTLPVFMVKGAGALTLGRFEHGQRLKRMRDDYDALIAGHVVPVVLSFDKFDQLVAVLSNGVSVMLGDDKDLSKKIPLVDPILSQVAHQGRTIKALDLRAPNTPVAVYK